MTLDDDVAVQIDRLRRARNANLRDVVNEVLRRGLRDMSTPSKKRQPFRTRSFPMGKPLINLDNAAETLAQLEGEGFK